MRLIRLVGSPVLTVWFITLFVVYYLTVSVWSEEAFAKFIGALSSNWWVRVTYLIFAINVTIQLLKGLARNLKKSRIRFFLKVPLFAGIVLFLFSSFLSLNLRQTRWILVGDGQQVRLPWEKGTFTVIKVESALKDRTLRLDESAVFDFEPKVMLRGPDGSLFTVGAFPVRKISRTYVHVLDFGIAPGVELLKDGKILRRGYMALKILPFGAVDRFEFPGLPYVFYLHIVPSKIIKRGDLSAREYDIRNPLYNLEILKAGKRILYVKTQKEVHFDGYTLRFFSPVYWNYLEMVRDPVYPFFIASLGLLVVGVLFYPFSIFRRF